MKDNKEIVYGCENETAAAGASMNAEADACPPVEIKGGECSSIVTAYTAEEAVKTPPITIDYCSDYKAYDIGDVFLDSLGRLLSLSLTLKCVCPGKEVAVGILLTELDRRGRERTRGFKAIRYPGHANGCHDVKLTGIRFVLPEFYDATGSPASLCNTRRCAVRVTANYISTDVPVF